MNYWVIMNEQQTMIVDNVDFVLIQEGLVTFRDKDGGYLAAFQLKDIVGFMRMNDGQVKERKEYKWDFNKVEK